MLPGVNAVLLVRGQSTFMGSSPADQRTEPRPTLIEASDKDNDHASRTILVNSVFKAFREKRYLVAVYPLNGTLHLVPRKSSQGIVAATTFLAQLGS